MWETVAQAVINGLLIGGIYALVSIGVTLIFGVVKIVNFAQGEFVMIGMYISFFLASQFGIDPLLSLLVSMPVLFAAGVLIQHFLIRRVLGPNGMPQIFLTFALSLLLLNLALMLFTANYRTVHTSYSDEAFHIGGLYIPVAKLIAFVVAMALSGALWVFLHTTDLGKAMRAAAQNRDVAMLMGINPDRVFCMALGIALALAGGQHSVGGDLPRDSGEESVAACRPESATAIGPERRDSEIAGKRSRSADPVRCRNSRRLEAHQARLRVRVLRALRGSFQS